MTKLSTTLLKDLPIKQTSITDEDYVVVSSGGTKKLKVKDITKDVEKKAADLEVKTKELGSQLDNIPKDGFSESSINTMKDRYDSMYVNVKDFGAIGNGVVDDSNAIKKAISYMCSKAKYINGNSGWKSYTPTLYFPSGKYLVTEKETLNCSGSAIQGYNIKGSGYMNTEIYYTYDSSNDTDGGYLLKNGGANWFGFSYIEDLSIRGNGNNNFWCITSQSGSPQANRFRRVGFFNLKNCVTVSFGTDNSNADLFRFDSCKASGINGWIFGIDSSKNSQSIAHSFNDCDFEGINGTIIDIKSGGTIEVRGGSWIVNQNGRVFNFDDLSGAGIGTTNKIINVYGTKFEYQYYSTTDVKNDYCPLFKNKSRMILNFYGCNFEQFSYKGVNEKSFYGMIDEIGKVNFENCIIPFVMQIKVTPNLSVDSIDKCAVTFKNCTLPDELSNIVIQSNDNVYQGGNYATVYAEGTKSDKCVDTQLNQHYGFRKTATVKKMMTFVKSPNIITSLPAKISADDEDSMFTFEMPIGAIITDIKIYFTKIGDGTTHTITITDNSDNEIIKGSHIGTSDDVVFSTNNFFKIIKTQSDKTFKVKGSGINANGGIGGFVVVEYY